jgi:hypothetical protein
MTDATMLVLGSLSGRYDAPLAVRESLVGVEGSFADHVDVAVYTGVLEPTPDRLQRSVPDECARLERVLGGVASDVPVVVVPGHHNDEVAARSVLDRDRYAPAGGGDGEYVSEFDALTYAPLDDAVTAAGLRFTQNPALVGDGVLLRHEFHPEVFDAFDDRDGRVYVSGAGRYGRYRGDCLNALFAAHDLGPGADTCLGGYYLVDVGPSGVESVAFEALGAVSVGECDRHADRGRQYAMGSLRCPFCRDESAYFEELLRSAAFDARRRGAGTRLSDLVGRVAERYDLVDGQRDALREFALERGDAAHLFAERPIADAREATPTPRDPTAVVAEEYLYASDELDLGRGARFSYFDRHGVLRKRETTPDDLPPAETERQRDLDESAYYELPQGEWLCFPRPEDVVGVWERVASLVADHTLYDARVGTEWTRVARGNESHGVMVAVPNYFDRGDVGRVYRRLRDVEGIPAETLMFKPLLYSMYGIDGSTAREFDLPRSTRYERSAFEE